MIIKPSNKGRSPKTKQLADVLHNMSLGDVIKVIGSPEEVIRTANSLSRTSKSHSRARFKTKAHKNNPMVTITCVTSKQPSTYILI